MAIEATPADLQTLLSRLRELRDTAIVVLAGPTDEAPLDHGLITLVARAQTAMDAVVDAYADATSQTWKDRKVEPLKGVVNPADLQGLPVPPPPDLNSRQGKRNRRR